MESVSKEQLTGYRQPTESEKAGIQKYVLKDLNSTQRLYRVMAFICGGISAVLLILIVVDWINRAAAIGRTGLMSAFALLLFVVFISAVNRGRKIKGLISKIGYGNFRVLDCVSEDIDPNCEIAGCGFARICTENGQYCDEQFYIDSLTAHRCKGQRGIPMLLMCQNDNQYYELFTTNKLNGR